MAETFDNEAFAKRMGENSQALAKRLREQTVEAIEQLQADMEHVLREVFGNDMALPETKPAAPG